MEQDPPALVTMEVLAPVALPELITAVLEETPEPRSDEEELAKIMVVEVPAPFVQVSVVSMVVTVPTVLLSLPIMQRQI